MSRSYPLEVFRIVPLAELNPEDRGCFGAKGVNLALLAQRGLSIPDGFAIAFESGRDNRLAPDEQRAVREAHAELLARAGGSVAAGVAVRSSGIGEDGAELSFAGQYETRLGVGADGLIRAVETCLASRDSERAASYQTTAGAARGAMGVLVQRMVPAECAGVCFTRSPLDDDEIAVELVAGLGDELMAGGGAPARVCFSRASLVPRVEADPDGVVERMGTEWGRELVRLSLEAEAALGQPADVEWAFADGAFQFLQARPITGRTTFDAIEEVRRDEIQRLRAAAERSGQVLVWTDFSVADMLPRPSPLGLEIMNLLSGPDGSLDRSLRAVGLRYAPPGRSGDHYPMIAGRTFINVAASLPSIDVALPIALDARSLRIEDGGSLDLEQLPVRLAWRGWRSLRRLPGALVRWIFVVPVRFFGLRRHFDRDFRQKVEPAAIAEAARLRERDLSSLADSELWPAFRSHVQRFIDYHVYHQITDTIVFPTHALLRRNLRRLYGEQMDAMEIRLTTGLPGNFNTETNLDLARVARGELDMQEFLGRYGQRGNPDYQISAPRWREDPQRVEAMASAIARSGADPQKQFEQQAKIRAEAELRFARDIESDRWLRPWRAVILRELDYYQRYSPLREGTQGIAYLFLELARGVLLEAARRTQLGELIFFLQLSELERLLTGPAESEALCGELAQQARTRRERLRVARQLYVPHALRSDDLDVIGRVPDLPGATELAGQAVSAGRARGRARVVQTLDEAREIEAGEILVTASADPSWTPLFLVAGGLVLEQGGLLSHPAIVAREYGLPAVVGVAHATRRLRTGQEITVDGDGGRVLLEGAVND